MIAKVYFCVPFILLFIVFGNTESYAQKGKIKLTLQDKRKIIKKVLEDKTFRQDFSNDSPKGTFYLSTENIPIQIRKNFLKIKDLSIKLVSPEEITTVRKVNVRLTFTKFERKNKAVDVYFESNYSGCFRDLKYKFWKKNRKWDFIVVTFRLCE